MSPEEHPGPRDGSRHLMVATQAAGAQRASPLGRPMSSMPPGNRNFGAKISNLKRALRRSQQGTWLRFRGRRARNKDDPGSCGERVAQVTFLASADSTILLRDRCHAPGAGDLFADDRGTENRVHPLLRNSDWQNRKVMHCRTARPTALLPGITRVSAAGRPSCKRGKVGNSVAAVELLAKPAPRFGATSRRGISIRQPAAACAVVRQSPPTAARTALRVSPSRSIRRCGRRRQSPPSQACREITATPSRRA